MILITGGMGFIGLHTARRLLDAGQSVVLTQHSAHREPDFLTEEIGKRVFIEQLDIADGATLLDIARRHKVDGIVHLAFPSPRLAITPGEEYRTNTSGLGNILDAAQQLGMRRVSLASSNSVYSRVPAGPYREDMPLPLESNNPIDAFKKAEEVLMYHFAGRSGLDVAALRIASIYGPLYYSMAQFPGRLCRAAVKGVQPDFSSSPFGEPWADDESDFVYVRDCAAAIAAIHLADRLPHHTYNIGGGRAVPHREVAEAVNKAVPGAQIQLRPGRGPNAKSDPYMDIARITQDIGWQPHYDVEHGVAEYIGWLREHAE